MRSNGHAIEARLYAENPAKRSCPPLAGSTASGLHRGTASGSTPVTARAIPITPFYDPLIAKVIAWGETRDTARERLGAALRAFDLDGIRTNKDFLIACLADDVFAAGDVSTGFIDQRLESLLASVVA